MKKILSFALAVIMVLALCACGNSSPDTGTQTNMGAQANTGAQANSGTTGEDYDPITLRLATQTASNLPDAEAPRWFCDQVTERSGGKVTIEFYPDASLYGTDSIPEAVMSGVVDIASLTTSVGFPDYCPVFNYTEAWFLLSSRDAFLKDIEAYRELLFPLWEDMGVKPLCFIDKGEGGFISKTEITSPEDLAGLMMRGASQPDYDASAILGATAIQMTSSEIYDAISKNAVDAMRSNYSTMVNKKIYDVCDYFNPGVSFAIFGIVVNMDVWNTLPAEVQTLLLEVAQEAEAISFEVMREADQEYIDTISSSCEVYEFTEEDLANFQKALEPYYANLLAQCEANGFGEAGQRFLDIASGN